MTMSATSSAHAGASRAGCGFDNTTAHRPDPGLRADDGGADESAHDRSRTSTATGGSGTPRSGNTTASSSNLDTTAAARPRVPRLLAAPLDQLYPLVAVLAEVSPAAIVSRFWTAVIKSAAEGRLARRASAATGMGRWETVAGQRPHGHSLSLNAHRASATDRQNACHRGRVGGDGAGKEARCQGRRSAS
jgi:hypothetical protein